MCHPILRWRGPKRCRERALPPTCVACIVMLLGPRPHCSIHRTKCRVSATDTRTSRCFRDSLCTSRARFLSCWPYSRACGARVPEDKQSSRACLVGRALNPSGNPGGDKGEANGDGALEVLPLWPSSSSWTADELTMALDGIKRKKPSAAFIPFLVFSCCVAVFPSLFRRRITYCEGWLVSLSTK